jgi:hypothetical protein
MAVFAVPDDEQLTINGVELFTAAWSILNSFVMDQGTTVEIDNTDIPDYPGVRAEQAWDTQSRWTLALPVSGEVDEFGSLHADSRVGLRENWTALKEGIFLPILESVTLEAIWVFRGETRIADVQVADWQITRAAPIDYDSTFDLIIPAGEWTVVGS